MQTGAERLTCLICNLWVISSLLYMSHPFLLIYGATEGISQRRHPPRMLCFEPMSQTIRVKAGVNLNTSSCVVSMVGEAFLEEKCAPASTSPLTDVHSGSQVGFLTRLWKWYLNVAACSTTSDLAIRPVVWVGSLRAIAVNVFLAEHTGLQTFNTRARVSLPSRKRGAGLRAVRIQ